MTLALQLLKAPHIGIKALRSHLSSQLKKDRPLIITDHGEPTKVILSYEDMMEILDLMDEAMDSATISNVTRGKKAIQSNPKGVDAESSLRKLRK